MAAHLTIPSARAAVTGRVAGAGSLGRRQGFAGAHAGHAIGSRRAGAVKLARSGVACSASMASYGTAPTPVTANQGEPTIAPAIRLGENEAIDMMGYLLQNRIIFIGSPINDAVASQVVAALLALEFDDPEEDIKIYINSPGGQIYSVLGIIDTMKAIRPDISTVVFGIAAQQSALLAAAGTKGKRYAMKNSRICIGQPLGGAQGSADEVNIAAKEINRSMQVVQQLYAEWGGQPLDVIEEETDRDTYLGPTRAIELGIIDGEI